MATHPRAFTRWTPDEYKLVAANALQLLDKGARIEVAFFKAQKLCLGKDRHRSREELLKLHKSSAKDGGLNRFERAAREMHPAAIQALAMQIAAKAKENERAAAVAGSRSSRPGPTSVAIFPRVIWTQLEESAVSIEVQALQRAGDTRGLGSLFYEAQQTILPAARLKTRKAFDGMHARDLIRPLFARGLSQASRYSDEELHPKRAAIEVIPMAASPVSKAPGTRGSRTVNTWYKRLLPIPDRQDQGPMKWTKLECAKVVRAMDQIIAEYGPAPSPASAMAAAQQIALSSDRWRSQHGFYTAKANGLLEKWIQIGRANLWLLKDETERDKPAELAARLDEKAQEAETALAPAPAPEAAILLPASPQGLLEASEAFGATLQRGLSLLLQAHAHHVLSSIEDKLSAVAQNVGLSIAAQIERGLRSTVVDIMNAELGGPVGTPAVPALPVNTPNDAQAKQLEGAINRDEETKPVKKLAVDVVGMIGQGITTIKQAFNGGTDLRFIDVDHVPSWTPRVGCQIVANVKFVNHSVENKARKAGIKITRVSGGPHVVIAAIEEMHRALAIPQ